MEWFTTMVGSNPLVAIIAMLVFIMGGVLNVFIIAQKKFGWFGDKQPDLQTIMNELQLISGNHLSHLPESERAIERIEAKLNTMSETLVEIKVILNRK